MGARIFVGRGQELAQLYAHLEDLRAGRGSVALVTGEAGIGKTTLVEEFAAAAAESDVAVVWGRCWEAGGAPPYWPWIQVIKALGPPDAVAPLIEDLGFGGHDGTTSRDPIVLDRASEDGGARFLLFERVLDFLRDASSGHPTTIILEDLHAADEASLLLLRFLRLGLRDQPVLLVGTAREHEARSRAGVASLLAESATDATTLGLEGLGLADITALVAQAMDRPPDAATAQAVLDSTGGNPFFALELTRLLARQGLSSESGAIPDSVRHVVLRRVRLLSEPTRRALDAAAVLGLEFDEPLLTSLTDESANALADARVAGLVRQVAPGRSAFAHALVRDTLYQELGRRRRELHARVAEILAAGAETAPAAVAHHALQAERDDAAVWCARAGDHASAALAYEEAVAWFERALSSQPADDRCRLPILLALGDALHRSGVFVAARDRYLQAANLARDLADSESLARAALGAAGYCDARYDPARIAILEEAAEALPPDDTPLRAQVLCELAQNLSNSLGHGGPDRREDGDRLSAAALEMARRTGDPVALAENLYGRHFVLMFDVSANEERTKLANAFIEVTAEVADPVREVNAHIWLAHDLLEAGDVGGAQVHVERAASQARRLGQRFSLWATTYPRAGFALLAGRLDEAERLLDEALAHGAPTGMADVFLVDGNLRFVLRQAQGRLAELAESPPSSPVSDVPPAVLFPYFAAGLAELGRPDEARGFMTAGISDVATWARPMPLALLAEACWLTGDVDPVDELYDELRAFAGQLVVASVCTAPQGSAWRYLGILAALGERFDAAEEHFEAARRQNEAVGAHLPLAHTLADHGRALLRRSEPGDRQRATQLLKRAAAAYRAMGMDLHLRRVEALLEQPAPEPRAARIVCEGEFWTISFGGREVRVKDSTGVRYLARLLLNPCRELHALDLAAPGGSAVAPSDAGPVLDTAAREAYRQRLADLEDDLSEADRHHDPVRAEHAQAEIDAIIDELAAGVGLGGRDRRAASTAERARQSVTRAVRRAVERVADVHPELGRHLSSTVRTGVYCSYSPDPRVPIRWDD